MPGPLGQVCLALWASYAGKTSTMEKLGRYIIRSSLSQEKVTCIPRESKVICKSENGREESVFDMNHQAGDKELT